jgi:hypothetical protein
LLQEDEGLDLFVYCLLCVCVRVMRTHDKMQMAGQDGSSDLDYGHADVLATNVLMK